MTQRYQLLDAVEFIRRFLLHVLPKGFKKIRHFGFLSPRYKTQNIMLIRQLTHNSNEDKTDTNPDDESLEMMMQRLSGVNIRTCPKCGKGRLARLYKLLPEYVDYILPSRKEVAWNTS